MKYWRTFAKRNAIAAVVFKNKLCGSGGSYIIIWMILISIFLLYQRGYSSLVEDIVRYGKKGLFFKKAAKILTKNSAPHFALKYQCIWAFVLISPALSTVLQIC